MNITTIVLIPGLWVTALCWEHWVKHYGEKGYSVIAADWPGMEGHKVLRVIEMMGEKVLPYFHQKYGRG